MKKIWLCVKKNTDRWLALLWLAAFCVTMMPLLYLSRYAVPGCDDYTYGMKTHGAWLDTHSLAAVLRAAAETAAEYWHQWQGTYSSIFLMTLSPGILKERWYFLTTFFMAGMLCGSICALVYAVIGRYVCVENGIRPDAQADISAPGRNPAAERRASRRWRILLCVLVLCFLSLQTMVAPSDGLYWYNGALHYVFMESVLFFQAAALLTFCRMTGTGQKARFLLWAVSLLLAAVLGGANLLTGLQSCILTAFLELYLLWTGRRSRKNGEDRKNSRMTAAFWVFSVLTVNLAGFAVNVLAPGNAVRETTAEGMGAVKAILLSFYWAAVFFTEWMTPLVLIGFLLMLPVLWKLTENSRADFFHPAAAAAVSFCIFAAMFTPTLFATSSEGPDRCKNIMRVAMYLLVFFNLLNALGWLRVPKKENLLRRMIGNAEESYAFWLTMCSVGMALLFLFPANKNTYTSISAFRSLVNGEAEQFYEENAQRMELYNDESLPDVTISYLTAKPYLLFKEDVGNEGSPDYWINISVVGYYRKNSVTVVEGTPE